MDRFVLYLRDTLRRLSSVAHTSAAPLPLLEPLSGPQGYSRAGSFQFLIEMGMSTAVPLPVQPSVTLCDFSYAILSFSLDHPEGGFHEPLLSRCDILIPKSPTLGFAG